MSCVDFLMNDHLAIPNLRPANLDCVFQTALFPCFLTPEMLVCGRWKAALSKTDFLSTSSVAPTSWYPVPSYPRTVLSKTPGYAEEKIISSKFRRQMFPGGSSPSPWLSRNICSFRDQYVSVLRNAKTWIYLRPAIRFWGTGSFVFLLWGPGKSSILPWPGASDKQNIKNPK